MIIDSPAEINLNGYKFLFEPGEVISVKTKEEVISESLDELKKLGEAQKTLYLNQSKIDVSIRATENMANKEKDPTKQKALDKELKKLIKQRNKINKSLEMIEVKMVMASGELEKYGYNKTERDKLLRNFKMGNQEEAEAEEKAKRTSELETNRDKIGEKALELEKAEEELEDFKRERGYEVINGTLMSPTDDPKNKIGYEPLSIEQEKEIEARYAHISDIESDIEYLEKLGMAQETERDEEGTEGELDFGTPEWIHRVVTSDELDTLPTTDDIYDDPAGTTLGDRLSDWLIRGGFQPEELGVFSDMIRSLQDIEAA